MMKKLVSVMAACITCIILVMGMSACGGKSTKEAGVTVEKYTAVSGKFESADVPVDGHSLELRSDGTGVLTSGKQAGEITWTLEGKVLTVDDDGFKYSGTLEKGTAILIFNGLEITYKKN